MEETKKAEKITVEITKTDAEPIIKYARLKKESAVGEKEQDIKIVYPPVEVAEILETSATSAWHGRCIEIKTKAIAGNYDIDKEEKKFLIDVFKEQDTVEEVFTKIVQDFENTGNCYLDIQKTGTRINEIYIVEPETMLAVKGHKEFVQRLTTDRFFPRYSAQGTEKASIYHIMQVNPLSKYYGYPTWIYALESLRLDKSVKIFFSSFFENGAIPDLILALEGADYTPEVKNSIKAALQQTKGVVNSHKTLLLGLPFENARLHVETITSPIAAMDFSKIGNPSRDEIIASHGVPPRLLNIIPAGQLGGEGDGDSQLEMFYRITVDPEQKFLEEKINKILRDAGFAGTLKFTNPYRDVPIEPAKKPENWEM